MLRSEIWNIIQVINGLFILICSKLKLLYLLESPNLIDTLSTWGPEYKVSLELKVNSFPTPAEGWAEVLRFTDSDTLDIRVPAMFINTAGYVEITPSIGTDKRPYPNPSTWYKYEMFQYPIKEQVRQKVESSFQLVSFLQIKCF